MESVINNIKFFKKGKRVFGEIVIFAIIFALIFSVYTFFGALVEALF